MSGITILDGETKRRLSNIEDYLKSIAKSLDRIADSLDFTELTVNSSIEVGYDEEEAEKEV